MANTDQARAIELDVPEGLGDARQAVEILRAFVADGGLMLSLNMAPMGQNVEDWGRLLGQIAHHVARAAALNGEAPEHEVLAAVHQGFAATLRTNQPAMSGYVAGRSRH